jgi:hypothetical protein
MGENVKRRKKPSKPQARILAKGLLFLKGRGKCTDVLSKIPDTAWRLLQQIADAARD